MSSPSAPQSIVAVGAHAADMEFSAGGAILKHAQAGWAAHIVHLTLGEKGSATLSAEGYASQKREDALAAAEGLMATAHFLPYKDGELAVTEDSIRELAILLRRLRPQVVITHWSESIHNDHMVCHELTRRALFVAAIRHFDLEGLPPIGWTRLYYADNWEDATGFAPYILMDITEQMTDWEAAFKRYAIGRGEGGFPYWDWYQARTRLHGIAMRTGHAEAFAIEEDQKRQYREML